MCCDVMCHVMRYDSIHMHMFSFTAILSTRLPRKKKSWWLLYKKNKINNIIIADRTLYIKAGSLCRSYKCLVNNIIHIDLIFKVIFVSSSGFIHIPTTISIG